MPITGTTPFRLTQFSDYTAAIYALQCTAHLQLLSRRQVEIALLVADGYPDKHIAARLGITTKGVQSCMGRIFAKLPLEATRNPRVQLTRFVALAWSEVEDMRAA